MFTEDVTPEEVTAFPRLLGVPLLSSEVLEAATNREAYFASARSVSFPFHTSVLVSYLNIGVHIFQPTTHLHCVEAYKTQRQI